MPTEQEIKQLVFTGKLIEALRPLAGLLLEADEGRRDEFRLCGRDDKLVTVGDCRRAKELIEEWERNY